MKERRQREGGGTGSEGNKKGGNRVYKIGLKALQGLQTITTGEMEGGP